MNDTEFTYDTTLNGGIVTVVLDLTVPTYMDRLSEVLFDGMDITPILDKITLTSLEMEAENAFTGDNVGDFDPARDAHRLGE